MKFLFCILFLIFFSAPLAADQIKTRGPMDPQSNEKLSSPIKLSERCSKVIIVEWQHVSDKEQAIKDLNAICNDAIKKFIDFVKSAGYSLPSGRSLIQNISLLNFDSNYRSLNDSEFRFYYRTKNYKDGSIIPIYGYQQPSISHIYIFNEIRKDGKINSLFRKKFAHELFHAMSSQFGLKTKEKEEILASNFEKLF